MAPRRPASLARWRRDAIRRINASRAAMMAFVARLPEPEALRPRTIGRWSVKDVLAHLVTCDEETLRRFNLIARGRADRIHWFESMADADRFNARSVARARSIGVRVLLRRMERGRRELVSVLELLPTEALADPSHAYPMVKWLPAPGWSHVDDHLSEIKHWRRSERTGPRRAS